MNVQIRSKDVTLSEHNKEHINSVIENFKKFSLEITTINVMVQSEKKDISIEFDIHVAHATPVVISQSDAILEVAIDLANERASKALRRLHDKMISKRGESLKEQEVVEL